MEQQPGQLRRLALRGDARPDQGRPLAAALAAAGIEGAGVREVAPDMETVFAYLASTTAEPDEAQGNTRMVAEPGSGSTQP